MGRKESGIPREDTMEDVIFQLQALVHIHSCQNCRKFVYRDETHFVVWHGDDYVTCLRLRDNKFLTHDEFFDYLTELAKMPPKEEYRNEIAAIV